MWNYIIIIIIIIIIISVIIIIITIILIAIIIINIIIIYICGFNHIISVSFICFNLNNKPMGYVVHKV